jgi:plastocyanin
VITATYDGAVIAAAVPGNSLTVVVSDPGVISSGGAGALATSVGSATVTGTYQGASASISFTVHAQNGISALLYPAYNQITGMAMWTPPGGVHIPAGSVVEFTLASGGLAHNVVFDAVPGAPASINQSGTLLSTDRQFPTAGVFTFTCTLHGETGVVTILQQ